MKKREFYFLITSLWCMTGVISGESACFIPAIYFLLIYHLEARK